MELKDVVLKLIGDVQPVGSTHIDEDRFENLKVLCRLVNELVCEIDSVSADNKDRHEFSVREMVSYVDNFLTNTLGIPNQ